MPSWPTGEARKAAVPAECAAVVKANAYGCGAEQVARALRGRAARRSSSQTWMRRGWSARQPHRRLSIHWAASSPIPVAIYAEIDCRPVIGDLNELAEWDVFCRRSGWSGGAAIHIDTGLNRLGLTISEAQGIIPRINAGDHGITLVMSHLVSAEHFIARSTPGSSRRFARSRACSPACRPRWRIPPGFF